MDEIYRVKPNRVKYITNVYPLIDLKINRKDCMTWMEKNKYPKPPRSACTFCPFHNNEEWLNIKSNEPEWKEVVELDRIIRKGTKKNTDEVFLHKDCVPIDQVNFKKKCHDDCFVNDCFVSLRILCSDSLCKSFGYQVWNNMQRSMVYLQSSKYSLSKTLFQQMMFMFTHYMIFFK